MKKIFIKLARLLGYEIIDQNNFVSPSLEKELSDTPTKSIKKILELAEAKFFLGYLGFLEF